jgi:glycosyltransferase involved in cell wall biosynthesis
MAETILSLYHDADRRKAMGKLGRCYVEKNFSRAISAMRLEKVLRELCNGAQPENDLIPNTFDEGRTLA